MDTVSLEQLREEEHNNFDHVFDDALGLHYGTGVDKFMEINDARMGEDSEDTEMRSKRADTLLQKGRFPISESFA